MRMIWLKYLRLACAFVRAFGIVWFKFPHLSRDNKMGTIQQWCQHVLRVLRVDVQVHTPVQTPSFEMPTLFVANHVSWLDILVIQSIQPCIFVAKREVQDWPIVGLLAKSCGVILVDRSSVSAAKEMVNEVANALLNGYHVAGFPEGTSSEGLRVQLFHANLFEAALEIDTGVQPVALRYCYPDTHKLCADAAFIGELSFFSSLHQVVQQQSVVAQVKLEKRLMPTGHSRRTLAHLSHRSVSHALAALSLPSMS